MCCSSFFSLPCCGDHRYLHSFPTRRSSDLSQFEPTLDRRVQILDAALVCFGQRGFHQTSMHDISAEAGIRDRKSTRLNSSHEWISYAVFCLKKKNKKLPERKRAKIR